jgi:solute:Na+ symporter, SSS family
MISSFVISVTFFVMKKMGHGMPFAQTVIISVAFTTVCWLLAAFLAPQTDRKTLLSFFKKVQPAGPGWDAIRLEAGIPQSAVKASGDHMGLAFVGWISGCVVIWASLFAIGKFLYGEMSMAWTLTGVTLVSGIVLLQVIRRLWK